MRKESFVHCKLFAASVSKDGTAFSKSDSFNHCSKRCRKGALALDYMARNGLKYIFCKILQQTMSHITRFAIDIF